MTNFMTLFVSHGFDPEVNKVQTSLSCSTRACLSTLWSSQRKRERETRLGGGGGGEEVDGE
jgi:hypothetical protein